MSITTAASMGGVTTTTAVISLWFGLLEAQFRNKGVLREVDKFYRTISLLDTKSAAEVEDLILRPPADVPYQTLRNKLISCFSKFREAAYLQLLDRESLGDRKPSQHFRHLKSLVSGIDEEVLKVQIRGIVAGQTSQDIDSLTELADRIHAVYHPALVCVVSSAPNLQQDIAQFTKQVAALTATISSLRERQSRPRSKSRPGPRGRSASSSRSRKMSTKFDDCWRPQALRTFTGFQLAAANGMPIRTYGCISIAPDLGLCRDFTWQFMEADVTKAIIGADFPAHFHLLPDLTNKCLLDGTTGLTTSTGVLNCKVMSVKVQSISADSPFAAILNEFLAITKPGGLQRKTAPHSTVHHIRTTPGPPISSRVRRLAPDELKITEAEFHSMLYLEDFSTNLHGKHIFPMIDLVKAFNQIPVNPDDIEKTVIITPFGLFEFPYMTFGLRNAAQTFLWFIDEVTWDLPIVFPYIDDIVVASVDEEEHGEHLRILFQRLQDYGLIINVAKSFLDQKEVVFLGHTVSSAGIKPP
ncbi:uncharacterized protein LOC107044642 [Diachasma alloeum]|uniref:uncharacterized protein LOC107044642 n=1 Tax=Diachasma alloeum TaxID=454923 RepID=UPI0007382DCC|nr:uncharacterized protein LOC107044642 [Diachasma alloeum]